MRVALITNIPAPYWISTWNQIAEKLGEDFIIFFCSAIEPNRNWKIPEMKFRHLYLKENYRIKKDGVNFVHNNPDVWKQLRKFNPDIVITGGFSPTMLYSFIYTKLFRKKHIAISDEWEFSQSKLSKAHHLIRRIVYGNSQAFLPCSTKGKEFFERFGHADKIFIRYFSIDHERFVNNNTFSDRKYDLMFAGQFVEGKNPDFFARIVLNLWKKNPALRVLLLGDGPMRETIIRTLEEKGIDYTYPGHVQQSDLPLYYRESKIFLFPTSIDAWGLVAQEAATSGVPVIITPYAGCAGELIIDNKNGFVLPLEEDQWIEKCLDLLQDEIKWQQFSKNGVELAARFNDKYEAGLAMIKSFDYVINKKR